MAAALGREPHRAAGRGISPDIVNTMTARDRVLLDRHFCRGCERQEQKASEQRQGPWHDCERELPNINPSNIFDVVGQYARAHEARVRSAVKSAYVNA
jgi:hypothetical protein